MVALSRRDGRNSTQHTHDLSEVFNALRKIVPTDIPWRMVPRNYHSLTSLFGAFAPFPHYTATSCYFQKLHRFSYCDHLEHWEPQEFFFILHGWPEDISGGHGDVTLWLSVVLQCSASSKSHKI